MSTQENTAIIVAAGSGSRLGSEKPKQFLLLADREILSYSVQTFLDHPEIGEVIIVTAAAYLEHVSIHYPDCHVVLGGPNRQDSVFNGLRACSRDTKIVLIHDAARPLIPARVIDDCLKQLKTFDGTAPAIKPVDTIVQLKGNEFQNLERDKLRIVQTPQCFHLDVLRQAHASGKTDTDEMGLVKQTIPSARLGYIDGAPEAMKVTNPQDIILLEFYAKTV
ncbi:MAG: 2-C-methyl-D-erythritol 4-phosphate cytidylyltransferase [Candidatus Marinimicrobia bacterium]|nr:2-C-methyl-D-erythritol 4-phosphate cytidylyltransferase [Candidatus Neomarinimicrobiota bacterium]